MVIVPKEVLEKLQKGISEDQNSKLPFDFDDFIEKVDNERKIKDYLVQREIEFVGTGSSRTAYLIPKGSCLDAKNRSVCFKIAKNMAGIGQNKAEKHIMDKYGKNEACFPHIFKYDEKRNICLESEIGSPLSQYDIEDYFKDWNDFMARSNSKRKFSDKFGSLFSKYKREFRNLKNILKIESIKNIFDVLFILKDFRKMGGKYQNEYQMYLDTIDECAEENKKYSGLASLSNILFKKGAASEMILGDFQHAVNYAMVYRDIPDPILIPIDYGLTEKIFDDFYGVNAKKEYFDTLK